MAYQPLWTSQTNLNGIKYIRSKTHLFIIIIIIIIIII